MIHQCSRILGHRIGHAYLITILFPIWVCVNSFIFKINSFFQSIVRCPCFLFPMQRFDFKNSIITIKLYLMILNLYLTSELSQEVLKSDSVVAVL